MHDRFTILHDLEAGRKETMNEPFKNSFGIRCKVWPGGLESTAEECSNSPKFHVVNVDSNTF